MAPTQPITMIAWGAGARVHLSRSADQQVLHCGDCRMEPTKFDWVWTRSEQLDEVLWEIARDNPLLAWCSTCMPDRTRAIWLP